MTIPEDPALAHVARLVQEALAERYAVPVVRVDGGAVRVPAGNAVAVARAAVAAAGGDAALVQEIDHALVAWSAVPDAGLSLWRQHGAAGMHAGELVTQLEAGDPPVQVVFAWQGWQLARTIDGATGWLEAGIELEPSAAPTGSSRSVEVEPFVAAVESLLGTDYVWGGTTAAGVDCSGLVQRAAWRSSGVWLPRHSTALLKVGVRVAPSQPGRGDVLVLQRRADAPSNDGDGMPSHRSGPSHAMHVAVSVAGDAVVHASRDAWKVVHEPLADVLQRYRVRGVRRLAREHD